MEKQQKKYVKKKTYYKKPKKWNKDTQVKKKKYYPPKKNRNSLERWVDRYNHTLELVRTITGILVLALQLLVLYKLFN
tara:strand:- start:682 stop:915 length:234 start_codon:yes stop_codon:yes gene_type:complete